MKYITKAKRLEKLTLAIREIDVPRHNGCAIKNPLKPKSCDGLRGFRGRWWCQETLVSRTAMRLIAVVFNKSLSVIQLMRPNVVWASIFTLFRLIWHQTDMATLTENKSKKSTKQNDSDWKILHRLSVRLTHLGIMGK